MPGSQLSLPNFGSGGGQPLLALPPTPPQAQHPNINRQPPVSQPYRGMMGPNHNVMQPPNSKVPDDVWLCVQTSLFLKQLHHLSFYKSNRFRWTWIWNCLEVGWMWSLELLLSAQGAPHPPPTLTGQIFLYAANIFNSPKNLLHKSYCVSHKAWRVKRALDCFVFMSMKTEFSPEFIPFEPGDWRTNQGLGMAKLKWNLSNVKQ